MKKWYQSKTMIANAVSIVAIIAVNFGVDLDGETQAMIATTVLAVINIVLRIQTNQGLKK